MTDASESKTEQKQEVVASKESQQTLVSNKEIWQVFEHRDKLLQLICVYLSDNREMADTPWQIWQVNGNQLKNTIWTLQIIMEDIKLLQGHEELRAAFAEVESAIFVQIAHVQNSQALTNMLKLLQFIFNLDANLQEKVNFAERGGFEVLLRAMMRLDSNCQQVILSFMARQFRVEMDEGKDRDLQRKDGHLLAVKQKIDHFVKAVRNKFFQQISLDYEDKEQTPAENVVNQEETKSPNFNRERSDSDRQSDRSRENSGNMLELDPNAKVLSLLRERQFLDVLVDCITKCDVDKLANILRVIQITKGFSTYGFLIFASAGVQDCILNTFEKKIKEGEKLHQSYEVLAKLCRVNRSNRIRVNDTWQFFMRVTHQIVDQSIHIPEAQCLLIRCFETLNGLIQGHHTNAVVLFEQKGLDQFTDWIRKVSMISEGDNARLCLANLLSLTMYILKRIQDKQASHEYALLATNLLMDVTTHLSQQAQCKLFLFTAQILKDNIAKMEDTPSEGLQRFVSENMKAVFLNCLIMLRDVFQPDGFGAPQDQRLQKLTIAVALLALEFQIKLKQHCLPRMKAIDTEIDTKKLESQIDKFMLYSKDSITQIDFEGLIHNLIKPSGKTQESDDFIITTGQSESENNCTSNQMTRLYIASRIVVAIQISHQLPIEKIIGLLSCRQLLSEDLLNPFLAMITVEQSNNFAFLIQDAISNNHIELLQQFCSRLMTAIRAKNQMQTLDSLLSLTLLSSGGLKCKQKIDEILNLQEIVQGIDLNSYSFEQQLFVLQCLFELILENWVYHSTIDSLSEVLEQPFLNQDKKSSCERFKSFLSLANTFDTLDFLEIDSVFEIREPKLKVESAELPIEVTIIKDQECRMRESPKSFNFFLLCLGQAHYSVQIPIFEDLINLAKQSLRNRRIMVQSMPQSYLLFLLHTAQQENQLRSPQKLEYSYIQYLSNLIQCLFSYGLMVEPRQETEDDMHQNKPVPLLQQFLSCLSQGRRLNQPFVESLIQTLSNSRSSVKKYVKLANDCHQTLRTCHPPNEHQVGFGTWLNLDMTDSTEQKEKSMTARLPQLQTSVLSVTLAGNVEIELLLLQETKKLSILDSHHNSLYSSDRTNSFNFSQDSSDHQPEGRDSLRGSDRQQRLRATLSQSKRFGSNVCTEDVFSIQLSVYRHEQIAKELITRKSADLEDMMTLSVFNALQFNHYCLQLAAGKLQLHINGHECFRDIDLPSTQIQNLILPPGASVSKVAFFDKSKDVPDIERLMVDLHEEIDDQHLMEVPTQQILIIQTEDVTKSPTQRIDASSPIKAAPAKQTRPSQLQETDGSFIVPVMTSSDHPKFIRVQIQKQTLKTRNPGATAVKSNYIETLISQSHTEVFQETRNLLTLKKCMTKEEVFKAIFHVMDFAINDDEAILLSFRLLAALLVRNQNEALAIFERLNGFKKLEALLTSKICEMHNNQLRRVFAQLIEISCNELNCSFRIDPYSNNRCKTIKPPILDDSLAQNTTYSRATFLEIALRIVKNSPVDQGFYFLQMLQLLLTEDRNLKIFHRNFDLNPILNLCRLVESNYRLQNLYDPTLALFELFINGIRRDLFANSERDLQRALDFILTLDIQSKPDENRNSMLGTIQSRIIIDFLSILAIHILSEKDGSLLAKLLKFDLVSISIMLLSKDEIEIREYAIKFFQLLLLKSPDQFMPEFIQAGGFNVVGNFLLNPKSIYSDQANPHQLYQSDYSEFESLQSDQDVDDQPTQRVSLNLTQILLDASVCRFDNVNEMSPENQTLVHQVMNQSSIAEQVVQQINISLKTPKKTTIKFFDLFKPFFMALQLVENDSSRYMCLKNLQQLLHEPVQTSSVKHSNMDLLHIQPGLLESFALYVYNFETALAAQSGFQLLDCFRVLEHIANQSGSDDNSSTSKEDVVIQRFRAQEVQNSFSRSVDCALEILTQITVLDLLKPVLQSKTFHALFNFPQDNDLLQFQVLTRVFQHYNKNPKINDRNTLLNLHNLISNLDDLVSVDATPQIILRAINLINLIAFKSSMEGRKLMKDIKLLQQRDFLIIRHVHSTYAQIKNKKSLKNSDIAMLKGVSTFSYETLASKPIFADNFCTDYLCLILLVISQPDRAVEAQLALIRQELKKRLYDEIMQFDQNISELQTDFKTYLHMWEQDEAQQENYDMLIQAFNDKVTDHLESQIEYGKLKTKERMKRRDRLTAEIKSMNAAALKQIQALKVRIGDLQKKMLSRSASS